MGFFDNVADKAVPQGSSLAKPLMLAFTALLASGVLRREAGTGLSAEPGVKPGRRRIVGRIRWTARKVPAERSWRRGEIMGRQRAKSTDPSWFTRFGSRSVDY